MYADADLTLRLSPQHPWHTAIEEVLNSHRAAHKLGAAHADSVVSRSPLNMTLDVGGAAPIQLELCSVSEMRWRDHGWAYETQWRLPWRKR